MSTAPAENKAEQIEQLLDELRTRLEQAEFSAVHLGPVERTEGGAMVTVQLDTAAEAEDDEAAPVTTTFEEDVKYVLNKNRELYRRLA